MKLIKPSFEIWKQEPGLEGIYKAIERAGRICYRSENKITEDSAKPFVDRMIKSGHGAMLEHGTIYLAIPITTRHSGQSEIRYMDNKYSVVRESTGFTMKDDLGDECNCWCVTTNYRVLVENNWLDDLQYICEPTEFHERRATVHFVLDRSTANEFVRHRVFSFAQESQRFCNYSNEDKFEGEITYCVPCWMDKLQEGIYSEDTDSLYDCIESNLFDYDTFLISLAESSKAYMRLLKLGWKPQQARVVLSNDCKTELVMTGFVNDWWGEYLVIDKSTGLIDQRIHGKFYTELSSIDRDKYRIVEKGFFPLRCSQGAHPSARELAIPLRVEFIKRRIF